MAMPALGCPIAADTEQGLALRRKCYKKRPRSMPPADRSHPRHRPSRQWVAVAIELRLLARERSRYHQPDQRQHCQSKVGRVSLAPRASESRAHAYLPSDCLPPIRPQESFIVKKLHGEET